MFATVEMCDIWTEVPVADLLLIFLNPYRHVATCRQQLGAAKANRLAWASGLSADTRMSRAISLVQTDELRHPPQYLSRWERRSEGWRSLFDAAMQR